MKIFLLEDDTMLCDSVNEYLVSIGHCVVTCANGDEAMNKIQEASYDLLLLYINVTGISGLELL